LVERLLWEQEVARSNRVAPTNFPSSVTPHVSGTYLPNLTEKLSLYGQNQIALVMVLVFFYGLRALEVADW
jgi:hypothetical protein